MAHFRQAMKRAQLRKVVARAAPFRLYEDIREPYDSQRRFLESRLLTEVESCRGDEFRRRH